MNMNWKYKNDFVKENQYKLKHTNQFQNKSKKENNGKSFFKKFSASLLKYAKCPNSKFPILNLT